MEKVKIEIPVNDRSVQYKIIQKLLKSALYDVTKDQEYWITNIELLRGDLKKLGVNIDDVEVMNHIMSNLSKQHKRIIEIIKDKLDNHIDMLIIEITQSKLSSKYHRINARSNQK